MSTSMFKMGSFEVELAQSMSDCLHQNKLSKKAEVDQNTRIVQSAKVVECLNTAATLLDRLGRSKEAEVITIVLEKLADKSKEQERSERFIQETEKFLSEELDKEEEPTELEMTSLLHEPKDEDDLGEQIIEMRSIAGKKKV